MSVCWAWVLLLSVLLRNAAGDDFGSSAWVCAFHDAAGSGESISSEEDAAHRCVCHSLRDGTSTIPGMKLDCSHRGFEAIAPGQKLPLHIRSLDLSWNNIQFLERGLFDRFRPIEELILSHNKLIKIADHALDGLSDLTVLNLSHNKLTILPDHFANLTALRRLDVSGNYLEELPPRLFVNMSHLDSLSLSGNIKIGEYIFKSPDALKDVLRRGLKRLELNHLSLTSVPANLFNEAYDLQELHIAHNSFTKFPSLFIGSLQVLNISVSNIRVLETGTFLTLPNLKAIYINHMKHLTDVEEGAFVGLKHLQILALEKCHNLTSFDGMAFGGPSADVPPLRILSLKHSGLQTLSGKLHPFVSNIKNLKLQGNPWNCDCRLKWFKQMNFSKENDHHIRCFFPESLHNMTISSLHASEFVCMTKKGRVLYGLMVTMAILFSLIALLVIVAFADSLRRKYCMYRSTNRIRYDPMMVQLHPSGSNWEDIDGQHSISFIRENRVL